VEVNAKDRAGSVKAEKVLLAIEEVELSFTMMLPLLPEGDFLDWNVAGNTAVITGR
jgi:hypothetical protein